MAARLAAVILGNKAPLVVEETSNIAELCEAALVVLMATPFWPKAEKLVIKMPIGTRNLSTKRFVFVFILLVFRDGLDPGY